MVRWVKARVSDSVSGLFAHGDTPLRDTSRFDADPGLCGPGSVSWKVIGDISAFVGGIRALLVQSAHPEVAAGVEDHSRYRQDPLGRLNRTSFYVTTATFGAIPEVHDTVAVVGAAHQNVSGLSSRNLPYRATMPDLAAWVHNTLTESFLVAYQSFGPELQDEEPDRFVKEQTRIGRLMGADPLPETTARLSEWIDEHPALAPSPGMEAALGFLQQPPIPALQQKGYQTLMQGAVTTLPPRIRRILGLRTQRGARFRAKTLVGGLRWAMRNSPAWKAALDRCGVQYNPKMFRDQSD